ncbi:hypothetical protein NJB1604_18690 [Mycobacterium marinum]|uniref:hypothetical protein n=1 Tax=Mycobacterium marinum TaxID=1781 RepID=UPI0021C3777C|nr:hypothetical protein [Mycobacterium marinum]GJO43298.1 hypothetical protein NJB1604_18690 [Mycobacterium marinum]
MALTRADLTSREWELTEMAFHESGHAVIGVALGGRLRFAAVSGGIRHGGIIGNTSFESTLGFDQPATALAGPWAQACWRHGRRPTLREVDAVLGGAGRKDAALLAGAAMPEAVRVVPILQRCFPAIARLAGRLYTNSSITHTDVLDALGLTEATAPMGLAAIRSGCAPGSFTITLPAA